MLPLNFPNVVALATLFSFVTIGNAQQNATGNPDSICYSYGVDFVDGGSYFINTASNDSFTSVSTFEGCNQDKAEVLLVDPKGDEFFCSQIPTLPDNTAQLSTCPILKSSMSSGTYMILILGNNGNGQPYAWQRDLNLDCGKQTTTTITPTVTFNITSTPIVSLTSTSTLFFTSTINPNITFTVPSATASKIRTITPPAVKTTTTSTITQTDYKVCRELTITTKTVSATCTTLSSVKQDKPCTYSPTRLHPAALVTPTTGATYPRMVRKSDRAVDIAYARARMAAARARRDALAAGEAILPIVKIGYDSATVTATASPPVNTTLVYTAAPSTAVQLTVVSQTATTTLPPVTVRSGIHTNVVTLPTPTQTRVAVAYATVVQTKTVKATFTRTATVTPDVSLGACRAGNAGGVGNLPFPPLPTNRPGAGGAGGWNNNKGSNKPNGNGNGNGSPWNNNKNNHGNGNGRGYQWGRW